MLASQRSAVGLASVRGGLELSAELSEIPKTRGPRRPAGVKGILGPRARGHQAHANSHGHSPGGWRSRAVQLDLRPSGRGSVPFADVPSKSPQVRNGGPAVDKNASLSVEAGTRRQPWQQHQCVLQPVRAVYSGGSYFNCAYVLLCPSMTLSSSAVVTS